MQCPYCEADLLCIDYYGIGNFAAQEKYGYGFQKLGDIYKCVNEETVDEEEMECYDTYFYTNQNGDLLEGYPC